MYEFDGQFIYFGGRNLSKSLKFRHLALNEKVALVVDEVVSVSPWRVRGVEIRGTAELLTERGHAFVRITPLESASWGL
jgi:pyridoxamine 5'-phosphate oxidase family protein